MLAMKKIKQGKLHIYITIIIGVISVITNCFINLFITPRITNSIGIEAYGYVTLAKNFVTYATILTAALNSYAARYMSVAFLRNEKEKFDRYTSTIFISDFAIGLILLIVGSIFTFNADYIINIEPKLINDVKILFLLSFMAFFINTISTVFMSTGYIKDRIDLVNILKTYSYIIEIIILVICFWLIEPNVWYIGLSSLSMALVILIGAYYLTKHLLPESKISKKYYDVRVLKDLVINGLWNSVNSLGNTLNSGLDLLVSNLMLTNIAMGQVSVAKTINNIIFALYTAISQAFQPKLLKCYSDGNIVALVKTLKLAMRVSGVITNCIFAGFIAIGQDFLSLWLPGQDVKTIYFITIIAMLPCITEGCIYPLYYVYTLTIKNKIPCIITIIGGFLNIVSMYLIIKFTNLGVYSIVITTAVIMNFIGLVTNPIYVSKCLRVKKGTFYPAILFNLLCLVLTIDILILYKKNVLGYLHNWQSIIISVIFLTVIAFLTQIIFIFIQKAFSKKREVTHNV